MISSTDIACRQLVAGKNDVILDEPTAIKQVLTDFLDRCEQYENELLAQHQQQQLQQEGYANQSSNNNQNVVDDAQYPAKTATTKEQTHSSGSGYFNEFRMLKELSRMLKKNTGSYIDGLEPYNRSKNRYGDIIPFNHTRVILSCNPHNQRQQKAHAQSHPSYQQQAVYYEPGSDYINANYIRGPSGSPRTYIASQGPLPSTLNDFWRMIWECNVSVIVMACNEHELGLSKCELYWPEQLKTSQVYGNIQVTLLRVRQMNPDFLIRHFSVKFLEPEPPVQSSRTTLNGDDLPGATTAAPTGDDATTACCEHTNRNTNSTASSESICVSDDSTATSSTTTARSNHDRMAPSNVPTRRVLMEKSVVQFHISSWPDHGVPDSVQPILELVRLVREVQPFEHSPILVHCSAGCGRTGTICCIDYVYGLMRMGKLDASFDLFTIISEMRQQRMAMVQTLEQYILCYRAVASLFMQQLQLPGHSFYRREPHSQRVCDAKRALTCSAVNGSTAEAHAQEAIRDSIDMTSPQPVDDGIDHLNMSNETPENSYKLYHNHRQHEASSSMDDQQINSDSQEEGEEGEDGDDDDDDKQHDDGQEDEYLGPVFI